MYILPMAKGFPTFLHWLWILSLLATAVVTYFLVWPVAALHLHNWIMVRIPLLNTAPRDGVRHRYLADISADGRYVVFATDATDLLHDPTPKQKQLYLYDRETKNKRRLHLNRLGRQQFGYPVISADGRYVAVAVRIKFDPWQIYLYDTHSGQREAIGQANASMKKPAISADGRYIAYYESIASLRVYDQQEQSVIDIRPDVIDNSRYFRPRYYATWPVGALHLSADGRYLAFAIELTTEPGCATVIYDMNVKRVALMLPDCRAVALSGDGRYLLYRESYGQDQFGNQVWDLTVHHWQTGETRRIHDSYTLWAVSSDGHFILYQSREGVLLYDLVSGTAENSPVDCQSSLSPTFQGECTHALSADGRIIVFSSYADDLVPGDINFANDLFVYDRTEAHIERISPTPWLGILLAILVFLDLVGVGIFIWPGN